VRCFNKVTGALALWATNADAKGVHLGTLDTSYIFAHRATR
jgi:hypothetical protein